MKIFATKTNYIRTAFAFLAVLCCLMMKSEVGFGQTQSYSTPGTYTFTVPAGVSSITVSTWGGGGAGGAVSGGNPRAGGGGEGGSFTRGTITVTPGATYTIVVGSGGAGGVGNGASGNASSFTLIGGGTTYFNAIGGVGGTAGISGNNFGTGGNAANTGNIVSGTVQSTFYGGSGGNGSNASTASSGGGGGSAGAGGNGGNGGTTAGGTAGAGSGIPADAGVAGANGRGSVSDGNGNDASSPGAGGGGARIANAGGPFQGGDGGNGQVNIIWACSGVNVTNFSASAAAACQNGTSIVTITSTTLAHTNYQIYYSLTGANTTVSPQLATLTWVSGNTWTFSTIALTNSGVTTVTINTVGCAFLTTNNTASVTVNARPTPTFTVSPGASTCAGTDVTYTTQSGQSNYVWSAPGTVGTDYTITSGGIGSTNSTVTLKWLTGGSKTVTVNYTTGSCSGSTPASSTTNVSVTSAPTGSSTQSFCAINNPKVADLVATGSSIKWYAAAAGGVALAGTTLLVNGTHYYASQTVGGCESTTRFDVTVTVANPAAPTGSASQSFCAINNPKVADLVATGSSIKWYAAAAGGVALAGTTLLVNGTHYYASQTVGGCEGTARFDVTVTVGNPAAPTGATFQSFCSDANPTVASLVAIGSGIQWYSAATGGSPLLTSTPLSDGTHYYASQTVGSCESTTRLDVTAIVHTAVLITSQPNSGPQIICASFPVSFSVTATGDITGYQWYLGATALTDNSNISGSQTATLNIDQVSTTDAGFYHVVVKGTAPCGDVTSADAELQVNQNIIINTQPATQTVCTGSTAIFNVTATGTGLTYQWRKAGVDLPDGGNISGATTASLSIANVSASDVSNYRVLISDGSSGCPNVISASAALSVSPTSVGGTVNSDATVCSGTNSGTLTLSGKTGTVVRWESSTDNFATIITPITNTTNSQSYLNSTQTTQYRAVVQSGVCLESNSVAATITVNPIPNAVATPSSQPACSGTAITTIALTGSVTGTSFAWSRDNTASVTGIAASGNGNISGTLTNTTNAALTVTFTITPTANTCVGSPITATVVVNPKATIAVKTASTCSGTGFSVTPVNGTDIVPAGTTYSWSVPTVTGGMTGGASGTNASSITGTLNNPTNTSQTATYTVTPTSGSCVGSTFTVTVTVNPKPFVTPQTATTCSATGFSVTPTDGGGNIVPAATTYSWSAPTVTGGMTGGASGTNASSITGTLNNPTNTAQTATYTVTPKSGSCTGSNFTVTVTVNPKPTIANKTASTCSGSGFSVTPANGTDIVPAGTTYSWPAPTVTGLMTGGATGTNTTSITGTLTNPTNTNQTATYIVTPTSGSCTGATFTITVTVTPQPFVTSQTVTTCSGTGFSVTPANGGGNIVPAGTTYSWSAPTVTGGMTGGASGTNASSITGTLNNPTNTSQTATYTVTPTSGSCVGSTFTVTVTVNPKPFVTPQTATTCSATGFSVTPTDGGGNIVPAATTYSWSAPTVTGGMTGGASGTNASSITGTLNNPTNTAQTATYTVTPKSGSCTGSNFTVTVTVNPKPTIAVKTASTCSGTGFSVTPVNGTDIVPAGTTYSWPAPTVTGLMTGGASGTNATSITGTLTNPTNTNQTATYIVTPTSGTCTGATFTVTVTVTPQPFVTSQTVTTCSGTGFGVTPANGGGNIVPAGTTYSWSAPTVTGGMTGGASGTNATSITGTLNNPTNTNQTATYTVTPKSGSCVGATFTVTVTVNPLPTITTTGIVVPKCFSATAQTSTLAYTATTQSPNTYSINWASGLTDVPANTALPASPINIPVPASLAPGTYTGTLNVKNSNGCTSANVSVSITINALPAPTLTNNPVSPVCANTNVTYTTQSGQSNYVWTFSGIAGTDYTLVSGGNSTSNTAVVSWITSGTKTVTVNYNNGNGCTAVTATSNSITVLAVPTGSVTVTENSGNTNNDYVICAGDAVLFTAPSGNNSYTFKVNGTIVQGPNSDNTYSTNALANGQTVTVDVANGNNCGTTFTAPTVTVTPLPVPILTVTENSGTTNDYIICPNAPVTLIATANTGSTYSFIVNGSIVSTGASNSYIVNNLTANATVAVMETNSNGCQATTANQNITVSPVPSGTLTVSPGSSFCAGTSVTFTANDGGTGSIYEFKVNGTTVQGPNSISTYTTNSLTNGQVVTVIVTNGNGCSKTFNSIPVTVNPLPVGTLTLTENSGIANDGSICAGTPVTFNATAGFATYDFQVNGISKQNTASHTYTISTLLNNDVVTVIVKSNSNCTTSFNPITITVVPSPTGTLSVSPSNMICAGDNVIFTADGGFTNYNFQVNGSTVQNGLGNTFTTNSLVDGDIISVDVTNSNSCTSTFNTITMQVNPLPTGTLVITESAGTADDGVICTGTSVTFTAPNGFANYNFLLNGVSVQNSSSRTYTTTSLVNGDKVAVAVTSGAGCIGLLNEYVITVNPLPVVAPITTSAPSFDVCAGNAIALQDATNTGGTFTWSSENNGIATVDAATGVVTGIADGTATIDYTFTNTNGCSTTVTAVVTVHALPDVEPITGNFNICTGFTSQLDDATNTGGTGVWSSSDQSVATIDAATGLATGVAPGTANISYAFTDANGCTTTVTTDIVVADAPVVAPITTTSPSSFNVCIGNTIKLKDATPGGTWSSVDGTVATISVAGIVTGLTAGTTEIRYTITTTCSQTVYASQIVTVNAPPSATISYAGSPFCTTAGPVSVTQTGTIGGTYSSAGGLSLNTADGTITPSASTPGTYTITYKVAASGGCGVYTTTTTVTITQAPSATIAYSGSPYCSTLSTATVTRTGTAGGAYSSTLGLSIDVTTGTITPSSSTPGTYTVTYIIAASGGCAQFSTTASVTITPAPSATIIYSGSPYCSNGGTATVTRTGTLGGTYTKTAGAGTLSLNSATGDIILGTSTPGTYTVTYSVAASGGCSIYTTTASVVITPAPGAVAGTPVATCSNNPPVNITAGSSATNYSSVVWTSSGTGTFANANSLTTATYTPSVADIAAGNVTLTLKANGNGNCGPATSTKTLTISAPPAAFTLTPASASICQGDIQSLTATSSTTSSGTATISSGPINVSIPDAQDFFFFIIPGTVTTNLNVSTIPAGAVVTGMSVNFNVTHTYDGDLVLNIKAPNGNVLNLVNNRGGSGDNFANTTISSTGINPINAGTAPFTATYTADNKNNVGTPNSGNLNFPGLYSIANGTWVLGAEDDEEGDVGKITSWSITFTYTIPTSPLNVVWSPTSSLYTDPGASTAYAGLPASTVYAKPGITTTYSATASNAANCSTTQTVAVTVKPLPVVTITADYCARAGYVRLTATSSPAASSFAWSTGATTVGGTTSSIDVDVAGDYDVTAFQASGCPGTATISVANELVVNGDFEAGNVGFTSPPLGGNQYQYRADIAGNNELVPEGLYGVGPNANTYHSNFWGHDHTTGSGNYMIVNGFPNGNPQPIVWQETVSVLPNTTYYFSAWGMSLNNVGPFAQLQFNVNGAQVGTIANLVTGVNNNSNNGWTRFYGTLTTGATTTSATISITDLQNSPGGNDFGLDDISFGTLSTFVDLISGPGSDAQTLCVNTAIQNIVYSAGSSGTAPTVTGLPPGVSATFNGVYETISGTPTAAGNYSYTITTTGSCQPATATGTITVQQQKITLSSGSSSPTICVNTGVNIGYTLSGTATGATATGLPSGVNLSAPIGGVVTITGTPTIAGSYPYTITTSGTCSPVTTSGTITVTSQTVALNNGDDDNQTVCINSPIANIRYNVGGTATGASVAGLPPGVNGNYSGGIFTITGAPTSAAGSPYTYTVTTSGTCNPVTISGTITVTPGSTLTLTSDPATNPQTVCKGAAIVPVTFAVNNGTGASVTGLPAGVTGSYSNGLFTISGSPTAAPGTYTYTITASGGCAVAAGTATGSITVQAQTIGLFSGSISPSVCANIQMPTPIVFTVGGTATGATVTGLPAGVTGTYDGVTSKFTIGGTPTAASGSYPYTVTTSGSCASVIATGTITISAAPIGGNIASIASICSGQNGTLTLTGSTGNIIRWEFSTDGGGTWTPTTPANTTISQSFAVTMPTQYRAVVGNNCSNVTSSIATIAIHNYWTGGTSKNWNVASNWSDGLAASGSCSMYTIPAGTTFSPQLVANTSVTDITIASGAHLELNDKMLTLTGSYNGTGTLTGSQKSELTVTGNAGTIHFTPNNYPTNLENNYLKTLTVNSTASGGAVIGDSLNIAAGNLTDGYGTVIVTGGTLNGNGNLILKSNVNGTAQVGPSTGKIIGDVTVERFIPPLRAWRFLTVPFSGSSQSVHDAWQEGVNNYGLGLSFMQNPHPGFGTEITGNNYSNLGYDFNTTYNPSYKVWDSSQNAWNTVEPPTISTGIKDYPAYCIFVRGSRAIDLSQATGAIPDATVLRAKGVLNQTGLSYTKLYKGGDGKTIFVGNPYASSIDITRLINNTAGIQPDKFWVWDPKYPGTSNVGGYVSYAGGVMAPNPSNSYPTPASLKIIESGQAFMLQLNSGNTTASMGFEEGDKITTENNVFGFAGKQQTLDEDVTPAIYTNLMVPVGDGLYLADGVGTGFGSRFSAKVNAEDANKLWNFDENIALVRETNTLAIELRPAPVLTDTLFYRLYLRQKPYTLQVFTQNFESMPPMKAWLVDRYLNTKTEVNLGDTTLYNFTPNPDTLSYRNRFMLVFNRQFGGGAVPVTKVINQENPNITGIANSITAIEPGVSVYPNPASTKKVTLQFSGMDKGYYEITVYSPKGQKLASREINYPGGNTSFPLLLNSSWNAGVYNVEIISKDSKKTVNLKLVISR